MKSLLLAVLALLIFNGCGNKNRIEVTPSYDTIYLTADKLDKKPQLIDGDENKLIKDIQSEMNKKSENEINLEYNFLLDADGNIEKILEEKTAEPVYSNLIASEVSNWKFEPGIKKGKAVKSQYKWELSIPVKKTFDEEEYKISADTMPLPVGGMKSLQQNIVYPEKAKQQGIEGKVLVQVFIDETGKVVKTTVLKSAGDDLDKTAMSALQKTSFTPGIIDGKPVKVKVVIPIVFKLS